MDNHVVIEKLCPCMIDASIERIRSFKNKDDAEVHAFEWTETLSSSFCGKHAFEIVEVDDNFVISVEQGGFMEPCEV